MSLLPIDHQLEITSIDYDPFAEGEVLLTALATESQQEIWASVQLGEDANCAYNESVSLQLQGELDTATLQAALQALMQRHEALRTTFSPDGQHLCITEASSVELPLTDLCGLGESEQQEKIAALQKQAVTTPFDLEHGPLFRVELLKLHAQEHLLLLTAHHIVFDGWSWGVVIPELGQLYSAFRQETEPELDDPDRFSQYALMLEAAQGSEEAIAVEQYWLQQFSEAIPIVDFPTDRPRPPLRTFDSNRIDWELPPALVVDLKQLSNQFGCSFMTLLLSSFEVFLHRLTQQTDLVVGICAAGQADTGMYTLVGHCVNLLPLRTQVQPTQSFSDYLRSRRSIILDAYDRQQFTFGRLIKQLSLPRDSSRIPLVPITFNIDRGLDPNALAFEGLTVQLRSNPRAFENFELFINATELGDRVTLECQYNTNLFEADTIRRRLAEFETLLSGIAADPDRSIATLPLLPAVEQQRIAEWNQTQLGNSAECLHRRFEAQVAKTPNAIALSSGDETLTYQELNDRANQLAHVLRQKGVAPDRLVGVCLERSAALVVALLGVLKAGGAYLPLDSIYPAERIAGILDDAQVVVLLTQSSLLEKAPPIPTICLDTDWETIAQASQENPQTQTGCEHLAYVIYTSGSTGKPKGVEIEQAGLLNLIDWHQSVYQIQPSDRATQIAGCAFDACVWELWPYLTVGASIHIPDETTRLSPSKLWTWLADAQITIGFLPTPLAVLMFEEPLPTNLALRAVLVGGDKLHQYPRAALPFRVFNHYGPTENTVVTTWTAVETGVETRELPSIGRPIANTQVHVLDSNLQPVPIGIPGELHISGVGLARGYLNRPDLTAEKFISHSIAARLYKTGDRVRYLPDGNLEFFGRIDNQVKIRGFRIELGEVEAVLGQHPAVRESVVQVWEATPGNSRLVGYSVLHPDQSLTTSELYHFLKQKLPDYMVPSAFVLLEALPLTPNGKIDRKALPQPDFSRPDLDDRYVAPRNSIEQQVAEIWQQVLEVQRVGIYDNFFEIGGYSLLATQAIARMRQSLAVELPLRTFFEAPTVAGLAEQIETIRWAVQAAQTRNPAADDEEEGEL